MHDKDDNNNEPGAPPPASSPSHVLIIEANSTVLCSQSDYFNAMLKGREEWAESHTKVVGIELNSDEGA